MSNPKSNRSRIAVAATATAVAGALALGAIPAGAAPFPSAPSQLAYGLSTTNRVVTFDLDSPDRIVRHVALTGLPTGAKVIGIDERPKTGELYVVLRTAEGGGAFAVVNPVTGAITTPVALRNATTSLPIVLSGERFGIDFNPSADALRITSDTGQNLRALPSDRVVATINRFTGDTFTDGGLSYDPIATVPRTPALGIDASAYTGNVAVTGGPTTLFNIDSALSDLTTQVPPNDGTQVKKVDVVLNDRSVQGFDIMTSADGDTAYVALSTPPRAIRRLLDKVLAVFGIALPPASTPSQVFELDLATGDLDSVGTVLGFTLVDMTVDTPAPAPVVVP